MKRRVLTFLLLLSASLARATAAPEDLISKVLRARGVERGVLVKRLSDGKTLLAKDETRLLSPASVTKIITSAAVLSRFTPARTFKTGVYYSGLRANEKIRGDLVVVGDGDPFIVSEKLWQLAADLRHLGIQEFSGDLVIDNSLFDDVGRDSSRAESARESHNAYDAPVSAFGVNFNTVAVAIAPGDKPGRPATVNFDPYPLAGIDLEKQVKTGAAKHGKALQVSRTSKGAKREQVLVSGSLAVDQPMQKIYRSVGDPLRVSGEYLRAFLLHEGINVKGHVRAGRLPQSSTLLLTMESYDLSKIVQGLNTFSNNYIADVLVKRLGAAFPKIGAPDAPGSGTFENGVHVLSEFLKLEVGITSEFVLENGSGLAIQNRLSAKQVVDVLSYMERRMDLFPEFLASLPATGWNGTLKKRFGKGESENLKGLIRAKTGTLTEPITVSSMAGYFRHPKHGLVAFCILENGQPGASQPSLADLRDQQDQALVAFMSDI